MITTHDELIEYLELALGSDFTLDDLYTLALESEVQLVWEF